MTIHATLDWDNDAFYCPHASPADPPNLIPTPVLWTGIGTRAQGASCTHQVLNLTTDYGLLVLDVQTGTNTTAGVEFGRDTALNVTSIPVDPSTQYTFVVWARGISNYTGVSFVFRVFDQDGSPNFGSTTLATLTGDWVQYQFTATSKSTSHHIFLQLVKNTVATDVRYQVTGYMMLNGSVAPSVFNAGLPSLYDNVTAWLIKADWKSGRGESRLDDIMPSAGAATLRLRNDTRLFSPDYPTSPLYGFAKAGRRVRLDLTYSGGTVTAWHGWLQTLAVGVGRYDDPFVTLHCEQGMDRLKAAPARLGIQQNKQANDVVRLALQAVIAAPTAQHYWLLDSEVRSVLGRTTALYEDAEQFDEESGITQFGVMGDEWDENTSVWAVATAALEAERAAFWQTRDGKFTFRNRHYWARTTTPAGTITIDNDAHIGRYAYTDPINQVTVTCYPREVSPANTVIWRLQQSVSLRRHTTKILHANVTDADGNEVGVISVERPVAFTDFTAVDGAGLNRSEQVSISVATLGSSVQLTIRNQSAATLTLTHLEVRGQMVTTFDAVTVDAAAVASWVEYGKRTLAVNLPALESVQTAQDYADFLLYERKAPRGLITHLIVNGPIADEVDWTFGTRLVVSEYQVGSVPQPYFVVGEALAWDQPNGLVSEFRLMGAERLAFWQVGVSALGVQTVLGY